MQALGPIPDLPADSSLNRKESSRSRGFVRIWLAGPKPFLGKFCPKVGNGKGQTLTGAVAPAERVD